MWPYFLTEDQIKKKIILLLTEYLKENYSMIYPKKYIYLKDVNSCIPQFSYNSEEIKIFNNIPNYRYFFHEMPIIQYVIIKKEIYGKNKNVLIVMNRETPLISDCFIITRPIISINPKKLIDNHCKIELSENPNISIEINDINFLMWESLDFIIKNIERYKNKEKLEDKHLVEIIFNEIIEEKKEAIYILKKILLNRDLFLNIYENKLLKKLKARINAYLKKYIPTPLQDIIDKSIDAKDFNELWKLLLIISYIKQFNPKQKNYITIFNYINSKTNLINEFEVDSEISPLFENINLSSTIYDGFIKAIVNVYLENNTKDKKTIEQFFNFPNIIKIIEDNINLRIKDPTGKNLLFFPRLESLTSSIWYKVSEIWLSSDFLTLYLITCFLSSFEKDGTFKLTDSNSFKYKIGTHFKSIDNFKKNIFFRIGDPNSEYVIKLNFLKYLNKCLYYSNLLDKENIPILKANINDDLEWKYIFEKFYIALIFSLEGFIETSLQFFSGGIIENYTPFLENHVMRRIEEIDKLFKEYLMNHYKNWVANVNDASTPLNVVNAFKRLLIPNMYSNPDTFFLILFIDCCHLGIWNYLKQKILNDFPLLNVNSHIGYSILPTSTSYARRALFSGLYPKSQNKSINEFGKFLNLLGRGYKRITPASLNDHFITHCENMFDFKRAITRIKKPIIHFHITIFNFSDVISHALSQSFLKSIIDSLYNSKIRPLIELVMAEKPKINIFFATDHGNSRCTEEFNWNQSDFNNYWDKRISSSFIKRSTRYFVSFINNNNLSASNIIYVESSEAEDWGLKKEEWSSTRKQNEPSNYYFANNFINFRKTPTNIHSHDNFGHGGSTMNEFIIPFAILGKKDIGDKEFNWDLEIKAKIKKHSTDEIIFKIKIINKSNKDIIFEKGHIVTSFIHHKFHIFEKAKNIIPKNPRSNTIIIDDIIFPKRYLGNYADFFFTFYQDEKYEKSKNFPFISKEKLFT